MTGLDASDGPGIISRAAWADTEWPGRHKRRDCATSYRAPSTVNLAGRQTGTYLQWSIKTVSTNAIGVSLAVRDQVGRANDPAAPSSHRRPAGVTRTQPQGMVDAVGDDSSNDGTCA